MISAWAFACSSRVAPPTPFQLSFQRRHSDNRVRWISASLLYLSSANTSARIASTESSAPLPSPPCPLRVATPPRAISRWSCACLHSDLQCSATSGSGSRLRMSSSSLKRTLTGNDSKVSRVARHFSAFASSFSRGLSTRSLSTSLSTNSACLNASSAREMRWASRMHLSERAPSGSLFAQQRCSVDSTPTAAPERFVCAQVYSQTALATALPP
mmetsp:Transcript_34544/g.80770  ORF Transcript_34544/g.80770 Transcript_34544/m.80770 type:complete len:214 (-) Transcript_34544:1312-1953(-)